MQENNNSSYSLSSDAQKTDNRKVHNLPTIVLANGVEDDKYADYPESERSVKSSKSKRSKRRGDCEMLMGLREGQRFDGEPARFEGWMLKRRKWPLKGWHKRYFSLDRGILTYAKTPLEMCKGRTNGSVDIGFSVIATNASSRRIDIDAEEYMYHIKVKNEVKYKQWVSQLHYHLLYRQHHINYNAKIKPDVLNNSSIPIMSIPSENVVTESKVDNWINNSQNDQNNEVIRELDDVHIKLVRLSSILQELANKRDNEECLKKQRKPFLKRGKKTQDKAKKRKEGEEEITFNYLSCSHLSLNETNYIDVSKPTMTRSFTEVSKSEDGSDTQSITSPKEFITLANEIEQQLRCCLKQVRTGEHTKSESNKDPSNIINSLRASLQQAVQQNIEYQAKLLRIHKESNLFPAVTPSASEKDDEDEDEEIDEPTLVHQQIGDSKSYESCSVLSISEYYDATDRFSNFTTSSEDEDDRSIGTDISEEEGTDFLGLRDTKTTGRRSKLPATKQDSGDVSLWSLLYKNIGKDLSKISMPVTLNEPLNMLQRLCEELEYSELLDKASEIDDPYERMLHVAAFAVSAYSGSAYRAGHKPFNPLLGETYELVREDKGFKFISEQVCHHPPISACHAESKNYIFWQDMRIKSKFWGKSMEIIPFGSVHVVFKKNNAHYKWNKVTTCVHNIFKGQRWVDQYGEMTISDNDLKCKLTFTRASYWSSKKQEVYGAITTKSGEVVIPIFGKWTEALYAGVSPSARCIWRPGAMPDDYELYYGFSRFAIELNELSPDLINVLPSTDTRFRPDQRLLEEGKIQSAEAVKIKLEQYQRERQKSREEKNQEFQPKWFRKENISGEDIWVFNHRYWEIRDGPGFKTMEFEDLWPKEALEHLGQ